MKTNHAPLPISSFKHLFDGSPTAIAVSRLSDGVFVEANAAFLALHGYSRDEMVGHTGAELRIWNRLEEREKMLTILRQQGRVESLPYEYRSKSGKVGRALASISVIELGGKPHLLGILTDIGELEKTQARLRDSELRFRSLFENSIDAILLTTPEGEIVAANSEAQRQLGRNEEELRRVGRAGVVDTTDPRLATALAEREKTGWFRGELTMIAKSGRHFPTEVSSRVFSDEVGRRMTSMVMRDITERKCTEQELVAARNRLQDLTTHLHDSSEAERRALAQDVHDHVGAALTGIRMKLAVLARTLPSGDEACREQILAITAMAERAMVATRDICTQLRPSTLDDLGLAETCRWYLRDWAATTGLHAMGRFSSRRPEPAAAIGTDLFRMLQELLTNVARHSGASGVRVGLSGGSRNLCLRVGDDGCGFAPDLESRGFGLAGIRERAARHGGRAVIESNPAGTVVTVTIPREGER